MGGAEHRRSRGELRRAVTWFVAVGDHAAEALFVQDDGGTIVDVDRQACECLGHAAEETDDRARELTIASTADDAGVGIVEPHGRRLWAEANASHGAVLALSLQVGS